MRYAVPKLRPPLKTFGGKAYLARRIVDRFDDHHVYCEPFAGGLSVMLNRPPALREVAADLNGMLIHFWRTLQDRGDALEARLRELAYAEDTFLRARSAVDSPGGPDPLQRAVDFVVRNRMSRGGLGKDFAWSERLRGGQPGDRNGWETALDQLPAVRERIRHVEFRHGAALDLLAELDGPDVLFYLDPPYLPAVRTAKAIYGDCEMTAEDHRQLLRRAIQLEGQVFLSGYRSALYEEALAGWSRDEFAMPNHSGQGRTKNRRVECLWSRGTPLVQLQFSFMNNEEA